MAAPIAAAGAWIAANWFLVATVVASAAAYYLSSRVGQDDENLDYAADNGLRGNTRSTNEPLKILYGLNLVGGNDVYFFTEGSDNEELWLVQTLGEGECNAMNQVASANQVWLDDKLESTFGLLVSYTFHNGADDQTYDAGLNAVDAGWTDNMRNTCYMVWHLTFDKDYFQGIPRRTVLVEGKKLYDFRDTTTAYSNNLVLCLYDYMTNNRYGMGLDASKFDITTWTSAANYCDTKNWGLNMAVARDQSAQEVIDTILAHFRGNMVYWAGKLYLYYADLNDESSVFTIEDEHILQDASGKAAINISQPTRFKRPDGLRVAYVDPDQNYIVDSVPVGEDSGVLNDLKLLGAASRDQALQLGVYNLERSQLDRTISGTFADELIEAGPHSIVTFNSTSIGIASQLMRVSESSINEDGTVNISMMFEALALYNDDYDLITDTVYSCSLPNVNAEPPTVTASMVEETYEVRLRRYTRLNITLTPPANYIWFSHCEVYFSTDNINWEFLYNVNTDFSIDPVEEGIDAWVRLKTVSIFQTKSTDTNDYKLYKAVGGHVSVPTSLTSLIASANQNAVNIFANKVSDSDVEIYEFRLGSSWSGAIFLSALRAPNLSLNGVKPSGSGGHTFWASTLSNNGLYGATPRSDNIVLAAPPDGWTVQDSDPCDYNAVGTHDNTEHDTYNSDDVLKCSHTGGVLTGTYTSPIYDLGASGRYMVYCLADIIVTGVGTTWGDIVPSPNTWASIDAENRTWVEIFALESGPSVSMSLKYGDASPPTNVIDRMEILSTIVTGRYFQMEITITDPTAEINALVKDFVLYYLQ